MCRHVTLDISNTVALITIDKVSYTYEELQSKVSKTQLESELLRTVENERKRKENIYNLEVNDVEELVASDMAKGDYHSIPLINGYTQSAG